jgi:hypothetical protein
MTGKKLKIALCLSGEPRSSMFCFPYIYESFIQPNDLYETDVYIHSFKNFRAADLYQPKKIHINTISESLQFINFIYPLSQFNKNVRYQITNSPENINIFSPSLKNLYLMFLGITNCFNLVDPSEYDIFIRCRFDIMFKDKFYLGTIIKDIISEKYDVFNPYPLPFTSQDLYHPYDGVSDQIIICNKKSAYHYSTISHNLIDLINQTESFRGEKIVLTHFNNNKLKIHGAYIPTFLVRNSQIETHPVYNSFLDQ